MKRFIYIAIFIFTFIAGIVSTQIVGSQRRLFARLPGLVF
jgi:hypothetical protein